MTRDPLDHLRLLRQRWPVILGVALLGAVIGVVTWPGLPDRPPVTYRATHILIDGSRLGGQTVSPDAAAAEVRLVALLVQRGEVPRLAATELGRRPAEGLNLAKGLQVIAKTDVSTLTIVARSSDPKEASAIADAFGDALVTYLRQRKEEEHQAALAQATARADELRAAVGALGNPAPGTATSAERNALVRQYEVAYERRQQLAAGGPRGSTFITMQKALAEPVYVERSDVQGRRSRLLVFGGAGVLLALVGVFAHARVDTRIRNRSTAEEAFGVPVLVDVPGALPAHDGVALRSNPLSATSEAFRTLRTALRTIPSRIVSVPDVGPGKEVAQRHPSTGSLRADGEVQAVLVTSAEAGDGTTSVVVNLAACLAESGWSVVVVDCDHRAAAAHGALGAPGAPGVSDLVLGADDVRALDDIIHDTAVPGVQLVPVGRPVPNPTGLLASERRIVRAARARGDVVLISAPPTLVANDSIDLVTEVDTVLLVGRYGSTHKVAATQAVETMALVRAPVLGVVMLGSGGRRVALWPRRKVVVGPPSSPRRRVVQLPRPSRTSAGDGA